MRRNFERMEQRSPMALPKGAAPSKDPRMSGSGVAHTGRSGAPTIYAEKYQGRKGGKGKRV